MTRQRTHWTLLACLLGLAVGTAAAAKKKAAATDSSVKNVFYVYADKGARVNHYIPSGWMGRQHKLVAHPARRGRGRRHHSPAATSPFPTGSLNAGNPDTARNCL